MTQVAGADVWKGQWAVVVLEDGRFRSAFVRPTAGQVLGAFEEVEVLALDIPIGLPKGHDHRGCDEAAKVYVGPRSASVFHTPPRAVLEAPTYREANRLSKEITGRGLSAQAYALRAKILEVDPIAATDPRLVEVHPEVSFRAMKGSPLEYPKKSWNGQMERWSSLQSRGIELPNHVPGAGTVPPDDLLDAAAAAWSAWRVQRGEANALPPFETDAGDERHCRIWY